ncbi:MAG: Vms1/Ankzf1 family peptidyl-tRNA hydrolase, partial [Candidatus Methanoperedens sp.]|nr:Vms1/Ankzf1 family peptidyl-tRNA hydrolase [Candidatus Methanoperedens sp.]
DRTLENIPKDVFDLMESSSISHIEKINSSTGKVIFYDADNIVRLVILPVFPIQDTEYVLDKRFKTDPLKDSLQMEKILVINAHAGETFIGIMETGAFIEHELIRSSVMGKHSKGGWSQKRFQSLVEEDIKHHADKVRDALHPIIEKNRDIQYVFSAGEGRLLKMILEGYEYPVASKSIDPQALNPQQVLKEVMSVRMYGL